MSQKKIYVGAIVNRDLEVFSKIKKFAKSNYNIEVKNLIPKKKGKLGSFKVKYFKKKLKKYSFSYFIVKLSSQKSNETIYETLRKYIPNIPCLNSISAVQMCESRRATFKKIKEKYKKINNIHIPKSFYSIEEASKACSSGISIIIKLDDHNSPYMLKEDRILGVANNSKEFEELIKNYKESEESLFFQEYLGKTDIVYKVYVVNKYVASITAQDRLQQTKLSPVELVHIRVPIDKEFRRKILKLGRKLGMSVFGVDYILTKKGKRHIIDINDFPSYSNIPEAVSLISDYMYKFITARQSLTKVPMSIKVKTYMM